MSLTLAGATALSAGIGALGNLLGAGATAGYNSREAQKDRDFQERMYNQQVQDNINFWKMQNEYNLPSAQLERLRAAGLNPQLAYGQSGMSGNIAQQQVQAGTAPHGSKASANFNTQLDFANLALLKAQIGNIEADTKQKESQTTGQDIQNQIQGLTKDIQIAIKYRDFDYLNESIAKMQNEIYNATQLTTQEVLSMMQGREYQIKNYQLDSYVRGQQVLQEWENVATNKTNASANWQNSIANLRSVIVQEKIAPWQIGVMQANAGLMTSEAKTNNALRPFQIWGAKFSNYNQVFDMLTKGANLTKAQADALQSQLDAVKKSMGLDSYLGGLIAPFVMMPGGAAGKHGQVYLDQKNSFEKYKLNY